MISNIGRFAGRVFVGPRCWEWQGSRNACGYGIICIVGKSTLTHRFMWTMMVGAIPEGFGVLHHCDNPPCVRPSHLFLGSPADNAKDKVAKGRARGGRNIGEGNPMHKLTFDQVCEIRRLIGVIPHKDIAARFGISDAHVSKIKHGKKWGGK